MAISDQIVEDAPGGVRVLELPFEHGAYWRKGMKHGPDAVRRVLHDIRPNSLRSGRRLSCDIKDYFCDPLTLDAYDAAVAIEQIEQAVTRLLNAGLAPLCIGGDHSISLPVVRSLARKHGKGNFGVLHFDAHSDTFPAVDNYDFHHGAIFRKMIEEGLIQAADLIQVGVRGFVRDSGMDFARGEGIHVFSVDHAREMNCSLASMGVTNDKQWYVSVDIDVVDPAFAPGTGTPVPGGFTSSEMLRFIDQVADLHLVGFDLVEVAPIYDSSEVTSLLAAHLVMETLIAGQFTASNIGAAT